MPTNIITINCIHDVITNTVTNHITNCPSDLNPINPTFFSNLSHLVVKVAEMPPKVGWEITLIILTALGAGATIASAICMAVSVRKMGEQIKISQDVLSEEREKNRRDFLQSWYSLDISPIIYKLNQTLSNYDSYREISSKEKEELYQFSSYIRMLIYKNNRMIFWFPNSSENMQKLNKSLADFEGCSRKIFNLTNLENRNCMPPAMIGIGQLLYKLYLEFNTSFDLFSESLKDNPTYKEFLDILKTVECFCNGLPNDSH